MLRIHCLGPLAIGIDGQTSAHFATDRARALLVYLALNGERPFRRDELAALLWPDQTDTQARQNLRKTLSRLRQAVPDLPLLQTSAKDVRLNQAVVQCDALQFSQKLLLVEQHNHADVNQCPTCLTHLRQAVTLYQGTFLQGFYLGGSALFEEWLLLTREHLQQQAFYAFSILGNHYEQSKEDTLLIETTQALLALEPWHERAQRQLLRALARSGQRASAIAHYEAYAALLQQELGIAPEGETQQLYRQLQQAELPTPPTAVYQGFPAEINSFVGRAQELTRIIEQLIAPDCRLLTITGGGGMGKTRLAVQAVLLAAATAATAVAFPDGLYFIPLAQLSSVNQIASLIAAQIGLTFAGTTPPMQQLQEHLQGRRLLLLLDNFEHLIDGAPLVADLLQAVPGLTCLVTSRHTLNLQGEWRLDLHGLEEVEEAAALFATRAQRYGLEQFSAADNDLIRQIARLVQGMPLALEMAAAWLRAYDLPTIAEEIAHNLDFLVSPYQDLPPRHRSMRAVFAGSWQLLTAEEQQLFACMSVFRGEFTLAAARAVTGASMLGLARLVDRSLVQRAHNGRYLIHELLREFAKEKLAQLGMETAVSHAHAHYYLAFLQEQGRYLKGSQSRIALKQLLSEQDNISQGWYWAANQHETELLAAALPAFTDMFLLSGLYENGAALLAETAVHIAPTQPALKILFDSSQAALLTEWGHLHRARNLAQGILETDPNATAAHLLLGRIYELQGDFPQMGTYAETACQLAAT
ncbi:MAG: AAA family ATPase, partial [Anaerolineales bacterium]|nr:AAA family ATPase [Anaerolineales bacterium]